MITESMCRERIAALRVRKLEQTRAKRARWGVMDGDDLGSVLPPEDFCWRPTAYHADGSFYGYRGWGRICGHYSRCSRRTSIRTYALAGRWMTQLWGMQPHCPPPEYAYPELHAEQQRYGLVPGIFGPQHFAPDYHIGLDWLGRALGEDSPLPRAERPGMRRILCRGGEPCPGTQDWMRRTLQTIRDAEAAETDPELQANLREMAAVNAWVIDNPPRTLRGLPVDRLVRPGLPQLQRRRCRRTTGRTVAALLRARPVIRAD